MVSILLMVVFLFVQLIFPVTTYARVAELYQNEVINYSQERVNPDSEKTIKLNQVELDIPEGAVNRPVDIRIEKLEIVDTINPGIRNITGQASGYRFKPAGMKFNKPVQVSLPYDKHNIVNPDELANLYTYFYNKEKGLWERLERVAIDTDKGLVISQTTHFTDMINGVLTLPESPSPLSFNPNSIKDIKVGNPGQGINLIAPPQANLMGNAFLKYPIELPTGRNGMQPQLAVQYNSDGGNGWMGMGWDVPLDAITIDTRWGVPRYDLGKETETYLLNGMQLTPIAHRGELEDRVMVEKVFHTRVEGQFKRIIRHGNNPSEYWWEVIDKSGIRYFYGGKSITGRMNEAVLSSGPGQPIFRWPLVQIKDTNNNTIDYRYERVAVHNGVQLYIKEITYTGYNGEQGPYSIEFSRGSELNEGLRTDLITDGRAGFKVVTGDLLRKIEIKYENQLVRSYELQYQTGTFGKSILEELIEYGSEGTEFNRHTFDYYDEARDSEGNYRGFFEPEMWNTGTDNLSNNIMGVADVPATVLGSTKSDGNNTHLYSGVGFGPDKKVTAGYKYGNSSSERKDIASLVDITGDGLPDKVFVSNGRVYYRANLSTSNNGSYVFGSKQDISTLGFLANKGLNYEESSTDSFGPEVYIYGLNGVKNSAYTEVKSSTYFSDVNADGLVDLVYNGEVYYNRIENGVPHFATDNGGTPVPIESGIVDDTDFSNINDEMYQAMLEAYPLMDAVRYWEAPYSGTVNIAAPLNLLETVGEDYETADGIRAAIQHKGNELWAVEIGEDDIGEQGPGQLQINVDKGDRIYFRLQSVFDGAYDRVEWNPEIDYLAVSDSRDVNNLNPYYYQAADDFTYVGRGGEIWMPLDGRVELNGSFSKRGITSDNVRLVIYVNGEAVVNQQVKWDERVENLQWNEVFTVESGDKLELKVETDSQIDLGQIEISAELSYLEVDDPTVDNGIVMSIQPIYSFDNYPNTDIESPLTGWDVNNSGILVVQPQMILNGGAVEDEIDSRISFTIKKQQELKGKSYIDIQNGLLNEVVPLVRKVENGDELYFAFNTRDSELSRYISQRSVAVYPAAKVDVDGYIVSEREDSINLLLQLALTESVPVGLNGEYIVEVSKNSQWEKDISIELENGQLKSTLPHNIGVENGDELSFTITASDQELLEYISSAEIVYYNNDNGEQAHTALYSAEQPGMLSTPYRGWGYFAYNGNKERALEPINEDDLTLNEDEILDENGEINEDYAKSIPNVFVMYPDIENNRWVSETEKCWIGSDQMSSTRKGKEYISPPGVEKFGDRRGVVRYSLTDQSSKGAGFLFASSATSDGSSYGKIDMLDLNGDRFPDIIGNGRVQYTTMTGGLEDSNNPVPGLHGEVRKTDTTNKSYGVGGNVPLINPNSRGEVTGSTRGNSNWQMSPLGINLSLKNSGNSYTKYDLIDMNGDGLPDRVETIGENLWVALNLGYEFAGRENWGSGEISEGQTINEPAPNSVSIGFNSGDYGFGGGLSHNHSISKTEKSLMDINGDGLPDRLIYNYSNNNLYVAFNTGSGFDSLVLWDRIGSGGHIGFTDNESAGAGIYATASIPIPLIFTTIWIIVNPGADYNESVGVRKNALMDVNGDGLLDYVKSENDRSMEVGLNYTGRTNKLKGVVLPLGGSINLEYQQEGNTYDMPQNRWVLSKVEVDDGYQSDGVDKQVREFEYQDGKYDRLEREFYGFSNIKTKYIGTEQEILKEVEREYRNDSFYSKGLLVNETVKDNTGNKYLQTDNSYRLLDINTGADLIDAYPYNTKATVFPQLIRTDKSFYEGESIVGLQTYITYQYDQYGNISRYVEAGSPGREDDLIINITYHSDQENYIVSNPDQFSIYNSDGQLLRYREADYQYGTGNLEELREYVDNYTVSTSNLTYYDNGNLKTVTGPVNQNDERYSIEYKYDEEIATHITEIEDSFGYSSQAEYNLLIGTVQSQTDLNGNQMEWEYDEFGRTLEVFTSYDEEIPAVEFEYYHEELPARAVTRNKVFFDSDNDETLETVTLIDGLKRVIQTKKEGEVTAEGSNSPTYGMNVSGMVIYDSLGRAVKEGQPLFQEGYDLEYYADTELLNPSENNYDILDRKTMVTLPDGSQMRTEYSIEDALFKNRITDPEGNEKTSYQDIRGNIVRVEEHKDGETITTEYQYNPLSEINEVIDNLGNRTTMSYDMLGQRISMDNPDNGLTEYSYDLAGNMVSKVDNNLREKGQAINYLYEYNRMKKIDYPESQDVEYIYGNTDADYNRVGRLASITDESGKSEFFYGKLGEEIKTARTMNYLVPGKEPDIFVTETGYDYLGRVEYLKYPDREEIFYHYDRGGKITAVSGEKENDSYQYIDQIGYDKFGQRVYIRYGNGVETNYSYDENRRWLDSIQTENPMGSVFQDIDYEFDRVGNVLSIENTARDVRQEFSYDDLYQLTGAEGRGQDKSKVNRYSQTYQYDSIGNIMHKTSFNHLTPGNQKPKDVNYNFEYKYEGTRPHTPTQIGNWVYKYDSNGNTIKKLRILDSGKTKEDKGNDKVKDNNGKKDKDKNNGKDNNGSKEDDDVEGGGVTGEYFWNEENRLTEAKVNGRSTTFLYDAGGKRTVKRGQGGETLYVNKYYQLQNRDVITKHIFVGSTRIVSKLAYYNEIGEYYDSTYESTNQYFYHPDHLGSSNFISDYAGNEFEHIEYMPYGETWIDEGSNKHLVGYRFTGKELDESTGLYYFGARYLDPQVSRWISTDPGIGDYMPVPPYMENAQQTNDSLPGQGGVFNPINMSLYRYSGNNPVKYVDPDGETITDAHDYIVLYQPYIKQLSKEYNVPSMLINAVIYKENEKRTMIHSIKDLTGLSLGNASLGICQVGMEVVTFLELDVDPKSHAFLSYNDREAQKKASILLFSNSEKRDIAIKLMQPLTNIEYAIKYLNFLKESRGDYPNMETWLSDYNRGLTIEDPPNSYGIEFERISREINLWLKDGVE